MGKLPKIRRFSEVDFMVAIAGRFFLNISCFAQPQALIA